MAASGFTPISLYYSTTASAVPTSGNLANGELGLNIADMKLYAKNSSGVVTLLASNAGASGSVTSVSGTGTVNGLTLTGTVTTSGSLTLGGTLSNVSLTSQVTGTLPTANGGTNLGGATPFTSGGVVYASSTSALATGSGITWDGSNLSTTGQILLNNNNYVGFKNTSGSPSVSIFNDTSNFLNLYNSGNTGTIFYVNAAEQMRLTSTGLGIGTSSPARRLDAQSTTADYQLRLGYNASFYYDIGRVNSNGFLGFYGSQTGATGFTFGGVDGTWATIGATGNVGIGTSSPTTLVDLVRSSTSGSDVSMPNLFVRNTSATQGNGSSTFNQSVVSVSAGNSTVTGGIRAAYDSAGSYGTGMQLYVNSTNPLQFFTNSAERMRIDSAGGVGIGTSTVDSWTKLKILGTAGSQLVANQQLYVNAPTTTVNEGVGIRLNAASGGKEAVGIIGVVNNATGTLGSMTFHVYNNGGDIPEWLRINNVGAIGLSGANFGTSGQVLTSSGSGSAPTWATAGGGGFSNMAVFTSSGTWSVPTGITKCKVTVTGGGGGAGNAYAGGAGGTSIKIVTLSGSSATITVGAAGSANTSGSAGTSSFVYGGTTVSATGGGNGSTGSGYSPTSGGYGTGGDINISGGGGDGNTTYSIGGGSYWGGGANWSGNGGYGAGGGYYGNVGSNGGYQGVVVIEY